jgi:putative esterase
VPGLTSPDLVWLVTGTVVVLLGGILWGWPRLARPGWGAVALRIIALCALQASMVSLIFVVVNRANDFYSSWTDLFGRYTGGGSLIVLRHGTAHPNASISVLAVSPVTLPGRKPGGTLQSVRIHGQLTGLTVTGHIYLPLDYARASRTGKRYPVIVVISTAQASASSPYDASHLAVSAAEQIAGGHLRPIIVVELPPGPGLDQGCLNLPGGAQGAAFFAQDLPAALESGYRVRTQRNSWALLGDSSGGYCALQLAMTNASKYSAVAVPAANYQTPPGPAPWGSSPQLRTQDNLLWLLQHQPMQPISVLFTGPGQAQPLLSLIRTPMHAVRSEFAAGPAPAAPVLDWLGAALAARSQS